MEIKKNGRVEHSANTHDDQVFSYLWALYVWYEGKDLIDNWGIRKSALKTDADLEESVVTIEQHYKPILDEIISETTEEIQQTLNKIDSCKSIQFVQWLNSENKKKEEATKLLMQTPIGRQGMATTFNMDLSETENNPGLTTLPNSIFTGEEEEDIAKRFNLYNFSLPRK